MKGLEKLDREQMKKIIGALGGSTSSCAVSCNNGYFACCTNEPYCVCIEDDTECDTCVKGGHGESYCEISVL